MDKSKNVEMQIDYNGAVKDEIDLNHLWDYAVSPKNVRAINESVPEYKILIIKTLKDFDGKFELPHDMPKEEIARG